MKFHHFQTLKTSRFRRISRNSGRHFHEISSNLDSTVQPKLPISSNRRSSSITLRKEPFLPNSNRIPGRFFTRFCRNLTAKTSSKLVERKNNNFRHLFNAQTEPFSPIFHGKYCCQSLLEPSTNGFT